MTEHTGKTLRDRAHERVENSDALRPYQDVIMYDWPEGGEHWEWVVKATIAEIVDWAATVKA